MDLLTQYETLHELVRLANANYHELMNKFRIVEAKLYEEKRKCGK